MCSCKTYCAQGHDIVNIRMQQTFIYSVLLFFLSSNFLQANPFSSEQFHVCTVASRQNENLNKLIFSCEKHHIDLVILGLGLPYHGNGTKLLRMDHYIHTLPDDDIVMFVDAFDVLVVADKEVILEKFFKLNAPFVMSAEKACYPFAHRANDYPPAPSVFKFINSGSYIGYVRNLKEWLTDISPIDLQASDQGQMTNHYLDKNAFFVLDYFCELFLPLFKVKPEEIAIDEDDRVVRCLTTGSEPCVIHANGKSFNLWDIIYEKLLAE
jgi:hypothetical protein